jgi:inner membrane protein
LDNLTHTLAGLVVADAAWMLYTRRSAAVGSQAGLRNAALTTSALASNAADLDFLYTGITPGQLGYLLHHRGHTHTLLAVVPIALFCVALVALGLRMRGLRLPASAYKFLLGLAGLACLLHVAMDFGNNYGVHPFWPLDNAWYYGDAIFIVEPWLMITLGGMAIGQSTSGVLRASLLTCLGGLLLLAWSSELAGPVLASLLSLCTLLWVAWLWRAAPRRRLISGAIALVLLWSSLLGTRQAARASVRELLEHDPALPLISLVSTPAPGNPLCWWVSAVQYSERRYVIRQALTSGLPGVWPVERCAWPRTGSTAPTTPSDLPAAQLAPDRVSWGPEFHATLSELLEIRRADCVAAAFLRFARVPFWITEQGRATLIGDYRFDRSRAVEFAEIVLHPAAPCPSAEPPWEPPLPLPGGR